MLKSVRLELARNPGVPEGDRSCGYELKVPLDRQGHIDLDAFRRDPGACTVHRFWHGESDRSGVLQHTRSGWSFSYEPGEDDDEPLFKLDAHALRAGEYVTVREQNDEILTFRVASVA